MWLTELNNWRSRLKMQMPREQIFIINWMMKGIPTTPCWRRVASTNNESTYWKPILQSWNSITGTMNNRLNWKINNWSRTWTQILNLNFRLVNRIILWRENKRSRKMPRARSWDRLWRRSMKLRKRSWILRLPRRICRLAWSSSKPRTMSGQQKLNKFTCKCSRMKPRERSEIIIRTNNWGRSSLKEMSRLRSSSNWNRKLVSWKWLRL